MGKETSRILIVGGGLAGLGLAGFLHQKGMRATVVEKTSEWRRVGWGIGLWPNGLALLDKLGAGGAVRSTGASPAKFEIRRAKGSLLSSVEADREDLFLAVHRADLHEALRRQVPNDWIRMGTAPKTLTSLDHGVEVTFDDVDAQLFDCVIGADGIHSKVREDLFPERIEKPRETVVWSFWVPEGAWEIGDAVVSLWGRGVEAFLVKIGERLLVNIAARPPSGILPESPALDTLKRVAEECGGALPALVAARNPEEEVFFDHVREVKPGKWRCGQALLIGDAAHALHPISGMGAALALEDGYVLAQELDRNSNVTKALLDFEARRQRRVGSIRRLAHLEERVVFSDSPLFSRLRDAAIHWTPAWEWIFKRRMRKFRRHPLSSL